MLAALALWGCGDVELISPAPDAGSSACEASCDDGNLCTIDACDEETGCSHVPNDEPCDDGDACTAGDACASGVCTAGPAITCNDGNGCTDDACDPQAACVYVPNSEPCDDGDACTLSDVCVEGACTAGSPTDCDDDNGCTDDTCSPETGCLHIDNAASCDDGDACTVGDACSEDSCVGGQTLDCDDGNGCTDDTCDSGAGCSHVDNAAACDDGDACTTGDVCVASACVGGPPTGCDDGYACTADACDPQAGCLYVPDDTMCDDGEVCTDDVCDPIAGCQHPLNVASCDDGDPCTTGDVCQAGQCAGGTIQVVQVAFGYLHGCAVKSDGSLWCWGWNYYGQVGDGTLVDRKTPILIKATGVVAVGAGAYHTCALQSDGSVWCWGSGLGGELGDGALTDHLVPSPVLFSGMMSTDIVALAVGAQHSCALTSGGTVWCWGLNSYGELGTGTLASSPSPVPVQGLISQVVSITAGFGHTCSVDALGELSCWGRNYEGQLGNGTTMDANLPGPITGLGATFSDVYAGGAHTCAKTTFGEIYCWGDNYYGSIGIGTSGAADATVSTPQLVPSPAPGVTFTDVSLGSYNSCALASDGATWCWGKTLVTGTSLQLAFDGAFPTQVPVASPATGVWAGGEHACAAAADGSLSCWGWNYNGDLGNGTAGYEPLPVPITSLGSNVTNVDANGCQTCAITGDGVLYCWGNVSSEDCPFINYVSSSAIFPPTVVDFSAPLGVTPIDVSVGGAHACARLSDNTLWCWGENQYGQLGYSTGYGAAPAQIMTNVAEVCAGGAHTCARRTDSNVWCWGYGSGSGTGIDSSTPSLRRSGVKALACGGGYTCVIDLADQLWCWGDNYFGQLGIGTITTTTLTPTWLSTLGTSVAEVTAGSFTTCARNSQGLWCWGENLRGQLGNGTTVNASLPTAVSLAGSVGVDAGGRHVCSLVGGAPWCWGLNAFGQLGDGTTADQSLPVMVNGLDATKLAVSSYNTCALAADGMLWCWGDNMQGELGTGVLPYAPLPTPTLIACQ